MAPNSLDGVSTTVHACQPADRMAHLMDNYVSNCMTDRDCSLYHCSYG